MTAAAPQQQMLKAEAILRHVRKSPWPQSREAQAAIGWAYAHAMDAAEERYLFLAGDLTPDDLRAPGMPRWDDPQRDADELTAARVYDAALATARRLAEYQRRENGKAAAA